MKKLITGVLATLACVACLTGCNLLEPMGGGTLGPTESSTTTNDTANLESAKNFIKAKYDKEIEDGRENYEVVNSITLNDVKYAITWTTDTDDVKVEVDGDVSYIVVNKLLTANLNYTLTATLKAADGSSAQATFKRIVFAAPLVPQPLAGNPTANAAYKFHVYQAGRGEDLYLNGKMAQSYYLGTTENMDEAVDIVTEPTDTENQFYLSTTTAIGKQYINIIETVDSKNENKKHTNSFWEDEATSKWYYSAEYGTMVTDFQGSTYYLGATKTYYTVQPIKTSSTSSTNYKGSLIAFVDRATVADSEKVAQTAKEVTLNPVYVGENAFRLPREGVAYPEATVTWTLTGENATLANSKLTLPAVEASHDITLTATITCGEETTTKTFPIKHIPNTEEAILDAAFTLKSGESFGNKVTLKGVVTSIDTAYDSEYANVTLTMKVGEKSVYCYRLNGTGADTVAAGYSITVTGYMKNYNGTVQFDSGCEMTECVFGDPPVDPAPEYTAEEVLTAAYALENGGKLDGEYTLTGKITNVDTVYSEQYKNVTVTIAVEGLETMPIQCFRLKGEGADLLAVGDTITVTGEIIKYTNGTVQFNNGCTFTNRVAGVPSTPAYTTPEEILNAAYALEAGASLSGTYTLTGKIINIDSVYSEQYKNITVTIAVTGLESKPIQCFRLKGEGADLLKNGDTITVTGEILKYTSGTVQFNNGCTFTNRVEGVPSTPTYTTPEEILNAAYALETGASLAGGPYTLTGKITVIDSEYSEQYGNITVTIAVEGLEAKPITCYRLKGEGANLLAVGDTITVSGSIKNHEGLVEFNSGCTFTNRVPASGSGDTPPPATTLTPAEIVELAYGLGADATTSESYTLTGVISKINTAWSSQYSNITVTILVAGKEDKPIQCYRLKGTGADTLAVGDTITVTGTFINYKGNTVQFQQNCSLDSVDADAEVSAMAKIIIEKNALEVPTEIKENGSIVLATVGVSYADVAISWESDNACAVENNGVITFTLPDAIASVKLTATMTCGSTTKVVEFTVTVAAALKANQQTASINFPEYYKDLTTNTTLGTDGLLTLNLDSNASLTIDRNKGTMAAFNPSNPAAVRAYAKNKLTFSCSGGSIVSISLTMDSSNYTLATKVDGVETPEPTENWTIEGANLSGSGDALVLTATGTGDITITLPGTKGNCRFVAIAITYEVSES